MRALRLFPTGRLTLSAPHILSLGSDWLARWAYSNGIRKVYSMVLDLAPGIDAEATFQRVFKSAGGAIVGSVRFPVSTSDFSPYVLQAKDANPDAIFVFVPGGAQPAALGKVLAERGITSDGIKVIGNDVLTDHSALKSMGDLALGIITASHMITTSIIQQTANSLLLTEENMIEIRIYSRWAATTACTLIYRTLRGLAESRWKVSCRSRKRHALEQSQWFAAHRRRNPRCYADDLHP